MTPLGKSEFLKQAAIRHPRVEIIKAGDAGEDLADAAVDLLIKGKQAKRYSAIRVPKSRSKGKHEIDLLVATRSGIAAIEVKHWGGEVEIETVDRWIQKKSNGSKITHSNPLSSNATKLDDLVVYLQQQQIKVDKSKTHSSLLLTNERVRLNASVKRDPNVMSLSDLETWLRPRVLTKTGLLFRVLGPKTGARFKDMIRVLDRLPTWDTIFLHGGRQFKGDLTGDGIRLKNGEVAFRKTAKHIKFHTPRTKLGILKTPKVSWKDSKGKHKEAFEIDQTLEIRISGRGDSELIPISWITNIEFGWQDESYYDAPKPPLQSYEGQTFEGKITGVQEYGLFVDLDTHRDGLLHVRKLDKKGENPYNYERGERINVKVLSTEVRQGKERIELDFA